MLFDVSRFSELGDFHLFWDGMMETPGALKAYSRALMGGLD